MKKLALKLMAVAAAFCIIGIQTGCKNESSRTESKLVRFPVLYLDMDGTTLGRDKKIRPATLEAISLYRKCGGIVGFASGRTIDQMRPYLPHIKPDLPMALFNGGITYSPDGSRILAQEALSADSVEEIAKALTAKNDLTADIEGILFQFADGKTIIDRTSSRLERFLRRAKIKVTRVCDKAACTAPAIRNGELIPAAKALVMIKPRSADALAERLKENLRSQTRAIVTDPHGAAVEIIPAAVNKARAIERIVKKRGFDLKDVVAFGDSQNDIEMLRDVGIGIAMENCHPKTCAAALFKTGHHETDAIAVSIRKLLLTKNCKP